MAKPKKKTVSGSPFPNPKQTDELSMSDIIEDSEKMKLLEKEKLKQQFQQSKDRSTDRVTPHCWIMLVFQTESQQDAFTEHFEGVAQYEEVYYDGEGIANKMGIKLPECTLPPHKRKVNEALAALVNEEHLKSE